nr:uncharacterized protein LOC111856160 [Paramormyrops kingsleyae]
MNEAFSAQSMKENGLGEETMGGEDSTALGQVCNVAAVARDKGVQVSCNGMERSLGESVLLGSQLPSIGTEVMDIGPLNHKEDAGAESGDPVGGESNALHQPPRDWLEPLEEDDDAEELDNQMWKVNPLRRRRQVNGKRQTVIKDKKNALKMNSNGRFRRRRRGTDVDGDWLDWPVLGEGWKRKEVFRRSGFSVGKTDTYYKRYTHTHTRAHASTHNSKMCSCCGSSTVPPNPFEMKQAWDDVAPSVTSFFGIT